MKTRLVSRPDEIRPKTQRGGLPLSAFFDKLSDRLQAVGILGWTTLRSLGHILASAGLLMLAASHAVAGGTLADRIRLISQTGLDNQLTTVPLPMNYWKRDRWKMGIAGGYLKVETGMVTLDGPVLASNISWSFADRWGLLALGFYNAMEGSGGRRQRANLDLSSFGSLPIVDRGEREFDFSGAKGSARQVGAGLALVWDSKHDPEGLASRPIYVGLLVDRFSLTDLDVPYTIVSGQNAGQTGLMSVPDSTNLHTVVFFGAQRPYNPGSLFRIVPHLFMGFGLNQATIDERLTGTSPSTFDTGLKPVVVGTLMIIAPGIEVTYRPAGLSMNLGASLWQATLGKGLHDDPSDPSFTIDKILKLNLAYSFGNYQK